ncbi:hypothetical protein T03_5771, partial [Trichinella britovi]
TADDRRTDWCRSLLRFRHGPYEKKRDRLDCYRNTIGWIICGKPHSSPSEEARVLLMKVEEPTDAALRKFWEMEAMGITPEDDVAPEDTRMMERFEKSLSFNGERY